jgi:hypothetical protein
LLWFKLTPFFVGVGSNGLYPAEMRRLTPKDCKVGDIVRDVCGQFSEIREVKHNANEYGDTKIILNNLRNDEILYGCSHGGVFLTIWNILCKNIIYLIFVCLFFVFINSSVSNIYWFSAATIT